ncbi:MAG TPA: GNAT family N-acetyltransferase [Hyphomonadaceae bacterium]|nr:GNAT family N-acetyltransferase [Hyphomonadaceae bacterium]
MIRDMQASDIDALTAIEKACFEAGYADKMMSREDFAEAIEDDQMKVFCCIADGAVAGYASLVIEDVGVVSFDSLAVSPQHQGKGLGEELFRHVERYCEGTGVGQLNLEIKETNYSLLKRYHRYGYKCFHVEAGFYADGWGAIRMMKRFAV